MRIYSQEIKDEVRALRVLGLSLSEIQRKKNIPKTTIRDWVSDVPLTPEQKEIFKQRILKGLQEGRIEAQRIQFENKLKKEQELKQIALREVGNLNKRDLFIAGIALYWAEGFKNRHEHRLGFCNSDPLMILFYIKWLESLGVNRNDIVLRLTLNKSYEKQVENIEKYWSELLGVSKAQFTKPFFQQSVWKKQFNTEQYKGVLRVHVKNSLDLLLKSKGWIEGLKMLK